MRSFRVGILPLLMLGVLTGCGGSSDLMATTKDVPSAPPVPAGADQMKSQMLEMSKTIKTQRPTEARKQGAPLKPPRPPGS